MYKRPESDAYGYAFGSLSFALELVGSKPLENPTMGPLHNLRSHNFLEI